MPRKLANKKTKSFNYSNKSLPLKGNLYRKNKKRISFSKLLKLGFISISFVAIIFTIFYGLFLYNKTNAESVDQGVVLKELSKIIALPNSSDLISIKRISNAKELMSQNDFYKNIDLSNGDYIIVYKDTIFIYNFDKNYIKKIKTDIKNLNIY